MEPAGMLALAALWRGQPIACRSGLFWSSCFISGAAESRLPLPLPPLIADDRVADLGYSLADVQQHERLVLSALADGHLAKRSGSGNRPICSSAFGLGILVLQDMDAD